MVSANMSRFHHHFSTGLGWLLHLLPVLAHRFMQSG